MPKNTCKAKNKKGEPCRAPAGTGGYCYLHANPDLVKTLGQQGGRKNRRFAGVAVEVPPNTNADDLNTLGSRAISLVFSGQLRAPEAIAVAHLINSQTRVIPLVAFENRFENLQHQIEQLLQRQAESPQGREVSIESREDDKCNSRSRTELITQTQVQANNTSPVLEPAAAPDDLNEDGNECNIDQGTESEPQISDDPDSKEVK